MIEGLVLIADIGAIGPRVIDEALEVLAVVPAGSVLLIERDKTGTDDRVRLARLERLRRATSDAGCRLAVNGRADLALASGADGVHLPEDGLPASIIRRTFPTLALGRSCHSRASLMSAGPIEWALIGPIRRPHSKPLAGRVLGFDGLADIVAGSEVASYALGGVLADDIAAALQAGATGLASIGAVFGTRDPAAAALTMLAATKTAVRRLG